MFDQPFFSRKQLNLIIIACVLAILLLSNTGSEEKPDPIDSRTLGGAPLYIQETGLPASTSLATAQGQHQIGAHTSLSFALPPHTPADHLDARLALRWLKRQLDSATSQHTTLNTTQEHPPQPIQLSARSDRLIICIPFLTVDDSRLTSLLSALKKMPSEDSWRTALQRLTAENYLDGQEMSQAERWLTAQLRPYSRQPSKNFSAWREFYQQVFSRSQLHMAVLGEPDERWLKSLEQKLQQLPSGQPWPDSPARDPIPQQRQFQMQKSGQAAYIAQLGRTLPGLRAQDFPQLQAALAEINRSSKALGIGSQWLPGGMQSQLRLGASSARPISPEQLLNQLRELIAERPDSELQALLSGLINHIASANDGPKQQWQLLENLAFYQLPTDFQSQQLHMLRQLEADTLRQRSLDLLHASAYFQALEHP